MSNPKPPITQEELLSTLAYSPATGEFTWARKTCDKVVIGRIAGSMQTNGYACIRLNRKLYLSHRLAFMYMTGIFPLLDVDHINGVRTDNRWCNLREVTRTDNLKNGSKPSTNTSGVLGVRKHRDTGKWVATVSIDNKTKYLGLFADFNDAVQARQEANVLYGFHKNHGRDLI